jgi:hypothetical protein
MADTTNTSVLHREARQRVISYALRRGETVATMVVAAALTAAAAANVVLPRETVAVWPLLGAAGVGALVITALKANRYLRRFVTRLFYERFDAGKLKLNELRRGMDNVLEQHRLIFGAIAARPEAPLGNVAADIDEWVTHIYAVAERIDQLLADEQLHVRMRLLARAADGGTQTQALTWAGNAIVQADASVPPLTDLERIDLWRLKDGVVDATAQLDDALLTMAHILHSLRTARPTELGRPFAERTQELIAEQRSKLQESEALINALFRKYAGAVVIEQNATLDAVHA